MPKNNRRPLLVLGVFLIATLTFIALRPFLTFSQTPDSQPTTNTPTPTPAFVLFKDDNNRFSFVTPSHWLAQSATQTDIASVANLTACDQLTLSIRQLPAKDPNTNSPLTAKQYLSASNQTTYSQIDGLNALVVSYSSPSGELKPYATAVIEATPSGQLIEFYYLPACPQDLELGKQSEFFPLLRSFRYNYNL